MTLMMMMMTLIFTISTLVMMIASILSKKSLNDREKMSPFECGFDPKSSSRLPFSLRFFLIAIVFLIFDVEIALILPIIPVMNFSNLMIWSSSIILFIIILLLGLYYEWYQGALEWSM